MVKIQKISLLFVLLLATIFANAEEVEINGIHYRLIDGSTNQLEVYKPDGISYEGDLVILPEVEVPGGLSLPVVGISESAFEGSTGLKSINIPASVKSIGKDAFRGCDNLKKAIFASIKDLCSMSFANYNANPLYLSHHLFIDGNENEVTTLRSGLELKDVKTINDFAFAGGINITNIQLPSTLIKIGNYAFTGCKDFILTYYDFNQMLDIDYGVTNSNPMSLAKKVELSNGSLPEDETHIESNVKDRAFQGAKWLKKLIIDPNVTSIGKYAFCDCVNMTSVTFSEKLERIGESAFEKCRSIEKVTIPVATETIERYAFLYCTSLEEVTIKAPITTLNEGLFKGCTSLNTVNLPKATQTIGKNTFYETSLTSLPLPEAGGEGLKTIREYAFAKCKIQSLVIPSSIVSIDKYAFSDCTNLSDITISEPETQLTILEKAFSSSKDPYLLPNLEHIYSYAQKAPSIKDNSFLSQKPIQLVYPEGASDYDQAPWNLFSTTTIGSHTITYLIDNFIEYKKETLDAGQKIPSVDNPVKEGWHFEGWIEDIPELMPNKDLYIHGYFTRKHPTTDGVEYMLSSDSDLKKEAKVIGYINPNQVTIPATVELGSESFKVVGIEAGAFKDATTLTAVDLSQASNLTSIGNAVFSGCTALKSVIWPATLSEIKDGMFFECTALSTFEIPATVTAIGDLAFSNSGITAITLPKSINTMGTSVFKSCTNLENVEFEPGMDLPTNMLPDYTFYGCTKLTIFPTLPSSTTIIGKSAFEKCSSLNSLELNETALKIISNQAFYSCGALKSIMLPATLESLGNKAFSSCQSLEKITINRSEPPAKENDSFSQYDGASLYVPNVDVYRSIETWNLFTKIYPIEPQELPAGELEITLDQESYTYTGSEIKPVPTVKWIKEGQETLTLDEDEYEVVCENNINAGENTATVTISDKEGANYKITGSRTKEFTIDKAIIDITQDNLFINKGEPSDIKGLIYDGTPKELIKAGTLKDPAPGTLEYSKDGETFTKEIPTETNAGTYHVYYRVKGDENHYTSAKSEKTLEVTIAPREKDIRFTLPDKSIFNYTYTGSEKIPLVTVEWKDSEGNYKTISNNEYEVNYSGNTDAGENTATVTISDKEGGNFIVNGSKTFSITKANIVLTDDLFETPPSAKNDLTFNGTAEAFVGTAQKLINAGTLKNPGIGTLEYSLTKNEKDFSSEIPTGIDAKTYPVYYRVKGNSNYNNSSISEAISVTIAPKKLTSEEIVITLTPASYAYDGSEKKPAVTVKYGETVFTKDKDFTVSYENNKDVGKEALVKITDKDGGNYVVSGSKTFTISSAASSLTRTPTVKTNTYDGTDHALINGGASNTGKVQYSLSKDEKTFSEKIPTGKNAGDYTVYYRVKGDANHSDSEIGSVKATITPREVSSFSLSHSSYTYDGGEKKPTVTVTWNNMTVPGSEYNVSYSNNKNVGTATVTLTDKEGGNYKVSGSKTFTITKAALTISGNSYEIFEGEAIPGFTVKYDGFVKNETEAVLTQKPIMRCSAIAGSKPGDYTINVSGAEAANYNINYKNGKLTILALKFVAGGDTSKDEDDPATYQISSTGSDEGTTPTISIIDDKDVGGAFAIPETITYHSKTFTVTEIGASAFENNTNLSAVTIPSSITHIGDKAFKGCSNLKAITVYITTPISLSVAGTRGEGTRSDGASVFEGVDKLSCVLYVPDGSVDLYKAAPVWCEFKHIVPLSTLTDISGVNVTEDEPFDIYNLQGIKVKSKATDLRGLPRGIYIINGKKVAVK